MKKYLQKKLNNEKGMTLIELLAVIVIIAIIAAIAIPAIGNLIQNSRENALIADAQNVMSAASIYFAENSDEPTADLTDLEPTYLESSGGITEAVVTNSSPNTITFTGDAGNRELSLTDQTNAALSDQGRDLFPAE